MTCIVAIEDNRTIYMGGDSAGVSGLNVAIRSDEKVFINGPFIMGFTTSFRMGQLLRYKFDPPAQPVGITDMRFMVTNFIDAIRKCFFDNGFGSKEQNEGGTFLVGYKGVLYSIHSDFQVGVVSTQTDAVGCGKEYAMGSLFATRGKKPLERIKNALDAASFHSGGVAPPYTILKIK